MKFQRLFSGRLEVSLLTCLLITACNPADYFEMNATIEGRDAFCSQATDLTSCQVLADVCQPAYEDVEAELEEPIFSACIANRPVPGDTAPTDGSTPDDGSSDVPPTIDDVIRHGCDGLAPEYLYVKTITEKKGKEGGSKKTTVKRQVKVKICHQTGNMSAHTIIIACPAVKAHKQHHDDYVGACTE